MRYANPAAVRLFPDLALRGAGHPWLADWPETTRRLREASAGGIATRTVAVGKRAYRQDLYFIADEEVVRVYGRDMTERVRAEAAAEEQRAKLEQANARLAEADRNKNEFLAVLSHELRNPLTPIRNSLHILRRAASDGEQAAYARAVLERQSAQLARLVDDLLDVTRISRNMIQLRRGRHELNDLVRRTVEDHRSLFEDGGIALETCLAGDPLPVAADEARLIQAIGNLLQNAAKFTPRGGRVRVETARDAERGRAVLRVIDDGAGIAPEMLTRLFQPFSQAEMTLDRSRGGLGLGLALVKGLAALHGGAVFAHSDGPGRGAEFVVAQPRIRGGRTWLGTSPGGPMRLGWQPASNGGGGPSRALAGSRAARGES